MRIGCVNYATEQGLGWLMRRFYQHEIITDVLVVKHRQHPNHPEWYPGAPTFNSSTIVGPEVDAFLDRIDLLLAFETPFDWSLVSRCRERGVKTVLCPMYEWTPEVMPVKFDAILAPSLLDRDYFPGSTFLPIPVDDTKWVLREQALRFLHNAGHIGHREHKGTRQVLAALKHVKSPIELTVTCQYLGRVQRMARDEGVYEDPRLKMRDGYPPQGTLYDRHDVYVVPEKFNGLSLPLQEACAAGLMVMASDRYPANTWLPREPLIPVAVYSKARIAAQYLEFAEATVYPKDVAATIDAWYGKDITKYSQAGQRWARLNSWEALKSKYLSYFEQVVNGKLTTTTTTEAARV